MEGVLIAKLKESDSFRAVFARAIRGTKTPVLVNSFGRSGSTMLFEATVQAAASARLPGTRASRWAVRGEAWYLEADPLSPGRVYKTHDRARNERLQARQVYVFGDAVAATASVISVARREGSAWLEEHCRHLRVASCSTEDIVERDALEIEDHLVNWRNSTSIPTAFVRFETIWDYQSEISAFLEMKVVLPARQNRTSSPVSGMHKALSRTYEPINAVMNSFADFEVRNL